MASLFRFLPPNSLELNRVVKKFTENECEKVERIFELHKHYFSKVNSAEKELQLEEEQEYLRKLDEGLFTLQYLDLIIVLLFSPEISILSSQLQPKISSLLQQNCIDKSVIFQVVQGYIDQVEDQDSLVGLTIPFLTELNQYFLDHKKEEK